MLAVLISGGCRTFDPLPPADLAQPGWQVRQGQAIWRARAGAPELAGELIVASQHGRRVWLQFSKTPLTLVTAQSTDTRWEIRLGTPPREFSGAGELPGRFGWLQLIGQLSGAPLAPGWRWEDQGAGAWRLENRATGEQLEGFLSP